MKLEPSEIRARRHAARLTQSEAAERIGVGLRTYGAWEAGETSPQSLNLGRLVEALPAVPEPAPNAESSQGTEPSQSTAPAGTSGVLLENATFEQVMARLVDIHNDSLKTSLRAMIRHQDVRPDLRGHDVIEGPLLGSA